MLFIAKIIVTAFLMSSCTTISSQKKELQPAQNSFQPANVLKFSPDNVLFLLDTCTFTPLVTIPLEYLKEKIKKLQEAL